MRVATLNVSTMRDKEEEIIELMKERKLEILGLCETRVRGEGQKVLHDDYRFIYKGAEGGRHGVGFVLTPEMAERVDSVDFRSERIIGITLKLDTKNISMIQVYAPQQGRPVAEKEDFYNSLQDVTESAKYRENVIIMGDWNGHVGHDREGVRDVVGAHGLGDRNADGSRIIDFCILNGLSIMNTYFKHKESHKWTWYRWSDDRQRYTETSMIDLFVTNNRNLFKDTKSIPSVSADSDHRMVLSKINLMKPKLRARKRRKRLQIENLKKEDCVRQLKSRVAEEMPRNEDADVEEQWTTFKGKITSIGEEVLGVKVICGTKRKNTAWWCEEVKVAVGRKMALFRRWMKTRRINDRQAYVEARGNVEVIKRRAKAEVWRKIGQDLEADLNGTRKLLYSMAKNYRKGNSDCTYAIADRGGYNLLVEGQEIAGRWREYFQELLNVPEEEEEDGEGNADGVEGNEEEVVADVAREITTEEVQSAILRMKNGKATGEDGLPAEIFKAAGAVGVEWLTMIFNRAYTEEKIPQDWQKAIVCPIYKNKGEKTNCSNYRGITLLSHAGKIYERIIEHRIRQQVEEKLGNWQYGFRPGRSTVDPVFALKMLLEKSWEWNKNKCIAFIDMEKAFDRINRRALWRVLSEECYGIEAKLVRVVKSIYCNCISKVKSGDVESQWFEVKTGVRQGGVLSPLLFIVYMDKCLRTICTNEAEEETLAYADDVAVITSTPEALERAVDRWARGLQQNGMKMNNKKTEVMSVGRNREEINVEVGEVRIQQVSNFTYLGVNINEENLQEVELNKRIGKYNANVNMLYPILKDKSVPTKCKTIIFNSILKPILLYGSETWALTTKTESKLQAAEMRVLRLIRGVTRMDRMRSTRIREELGVGSVTEEVEETKLRWYGHVKRMNDSRHAKKYMEWVPQGRRPVGRPRRRWIEGVEAGLRRRGITLGEVEQHRLYEDRAEWRGLVRSSFS